MKRLNARIERHINKSKSINTNNTEAREWSAENIRLLKAVTANSRRCLDVMVNERTTDLMLYSQELALTTYELKEKLINAAIEVAIRTSGKNRGSIKDIAADVRRALNKY